MKKLLFFFIIVASSAMSQPLTVSTAKLNDICFQLCRGYINAIPAGGVSPYVYQWSTGATTVGINQLCAGTYTVTVTDAVMTTKSAVVTITEPSLLTFSVLVSGNTASAINVMGGTTPYTYAWSNGATTATITGLSSGAYYITVRDKKGCKLTQSAIIP